MPGSGKLRGGAGGAGQAALSRSLQGQPEMALEQTTGKDWYQILGAQPSDSPAELKRKYQRLALLYHPDKQKADVPAGEVEERVQRFIEIDQAWKILGNEETKKEYDLQQHGISFGRNHSILLTILFVLTIYWDVFLWLHLSKGEQVMQRNSENLTSCGPGVTYCSRSSSCKGIKMGPFQSQPCCDSVDSTEDNLTKEWPLHAQIYLEDMSWNEDEQCYTLSCRCGGSYAVSESESKDVSLVCCDTCSLVIEILR